MSIGYGYDRRLSSSKRFVKVVFNMRERFSFVNRDEVSEKIVDVGWCYGSIRDGVCGGVVVDLGGENVEIWSKDVDVFVVIREVSMFIVEGGSIDSDGEFGGSGGVIIGVFVVVVRIC